MWPVLGVPLALSFGSLALGSLALGSLALAPEFSIGFVLVRQVLRAVLGSDKNGHGDRHRQEDKGLHDCIERSDLQLKVCLMLCCPSGKSERSGCDYNV